MKKIKHIIVMILNCIDDEISVDLHENVDDDIVNDSNAHDNNETLHEKDENGLLLTG